MKPTRFLLPLLVAALLGVATSARAQTAVERQLLRPDPRIAQRATLDAPLIFAVVAESAATPVWNGQGLWPTRPAGLRGLHAVLDATPANDPVWDPSAAAWFAFAYGALVRVEPDGRLPVVLESLPGHDFDVRAGRGLLVYRDPTTDQIVLLRLDGTAAPRVLLSGDFYNPRFSPDGSQIAVSQLRDGGGHLWLVDTASGRARDLGRGYDPAWRPDGRQLLFLRLDDNGHELTASHLYLCQPVSGAVQRLATTRRHLVTHPTFSPDGELIAFVDDVNGQLMVARLPEIGGGR